MKILEIMKKRHSVRQYEDKKIEYEKRDILDVLIREINEETNLHIQVFYDEPDCFNSALAHYGRVFGVKNYICMVGKKAEKLDENCGYFGEQLVLKAQELGLNTCWVALTHGKSKAIVLPDEKEAIIIALGYGKNQGKMHRNKDMRKVCNVDMNSPDWFIKGMEAVQLAPTAINQQQYYFTYQKDGKVSAVSKWGPYSKIDLGIVKYHFEAVTGIQVE
ncbi:MAG: nitroreductase family protein [Bacillota bacterium]|nr:nitroreductase family protein [Bacillota bacterium]